MIEIVLVQSETQVQQVRVLSREYIAWLDELDRSMGTYDPEVNKEYGYGDGEAQLPGEYVAPDGCLLLAVDDTKPIGCVALRKLSTSICEMKMLFVRQEYQGLGIGRALVIALLEEGKKMGYSSARLESSPDLTSAYRLYLSLGFQKIEPYFERQHSIKDTLIFMEKPLV